MNKQQLYAIINESDDYLTRRFEYPGRLNNYHCKTVAIFISFKRAKQYCYNTGIDMRYNRIVKINLDIEEEYDLTNNDIRDWSHHLGKFLED